MTKTYDRRAMMIEAHAAATLCVGNAFYAGRSYASVFAGQLKRVWAEAKRAVARAIRAAAQTPADKIKAAIAALESKDRWTREDYAARDALAADLRAAA